MEGSTIIFYLLAAMTVGFGFMAVTSRQIFRSAIYLLFSLVGVAGIYFWLNYQFIGAVQVVVYVGGIVVLIIFSIFLTQQAGEKLPKQTLNRKIFSALAVFCAFALTILQLYKNIFYQTNELPVTAGVKDIGAKLLSTKEGGYALPFEIISMLLLAALVGCIVIAASPKPASPYPSQGGELKDSKENTKT
jgi:NADH-quinone oxidoreductase subunit J